MTNTATSFCIACNEEVAYEVDGSKQYCCKCGRTPEAARAAFCAQKQQKRSKMFEWVGYLIGLPLFIILAQIFTPSILYQTFGKVLGILLVIGPVVGIVALYKWARKRST